MKFLVFIFAMLLISGCAKEIVQQEEEKFHIHATFKVYIEDKAIDFSVPLYQLKAQFVHVEDGIGDIIHVHQEGITLGYFFDTLGIEYNQSCIKLPDRESYCNESIFFVNGQESSDFEDYEINNLDEMLVSYGEGSTENQLKTVMGWAIAQGTI